MEINDAGRRDSTVADSVTGVQRASAIALIISLAAFITFTLSYNLPESTVKSREIPLINAVMRPWLVQNWHLFGPNPPKDNETMWVAVRAYTDDGVVELPAFDIQSAMTCRIDGRPQLPTKRDRVALSMHGSLTRYRSRLARIADMPVGDRAASRLALDKEFAPALDTVTRFISAYAVRQYPRERILSVRAIFTATPIVPFPERYSNASPAAVDRNPMSTDWHPVAPEQGTVTASC